MKFGAFFGKGGIHASQIKTYPFLVFFGFGVVPLFIVFLYFDVKEIAVRIFAQCIQNDCTSL